jgi:hypothetical protein
MKSPIASYMKLLQERKNKRINRWRRWLLQGKGYSDIAQLEEEETGTSLTRQAVRAWCIRNEKELGL